MKTQTIYVDACTSTGIAIGRRNTYATEQIVFGLAPLVQQYGAGSAVLMVLRPTDTTPYPAVTSQSGTELTWTVSATDTSVPGTGECELYWYVDGGLAKSVIFPLTIQRDIITEPIDEPPEPYQTWVDDLTELGAETLQNAQAAAQSATAAEAAKTAAQAAQTGAEAAKTAAQGAQAGAETARTGAEAAQTAAETAQGKAEDAQESAESAKTDAEEASRQAEEALEEFTTPTASATTLEPDEEATASYANGHFTFGIPQGVQGQPGQPGQPGVTPDFSIGTVQTLQPSQPATASITGTAEHPVLNLGIPQGMQGDPATNLVQSVNGKTGAVVLDAGDIGYDGETTYPDASVGKEITTINSALSSLSAVTEIIDTSSGAIASFPDGSGLPMRSLVAEIEPVQDLHGYDAPWPAGGGGNLADPSSFTLNLVTESNGIYSASDGDTASSLVFKIQQYNGGSFISGTQTQTSAITSAQRIRLATTINASATRLKFANNGATREFSVFIPIGSALIGETVTFSVDITDVTIGACKFKDIQLEKGNIQTPVYKPYSNICPISGWTGLSGQRTGVNIWDEVWEVGGVNPSTGGNWNADTRIRSKNYIPIKPNTTYFNSYPSYGVGIDYCFYDINKTFISSGSAASVTITSPQNAYFMRFATYGQYGTTYNHDISINYPSTDTAYHAYTGEAISVSWQDTAGTVYGGTLDVVSGLLTVDRAMVEYDGSSDENWDEYGTDSDHYCCVIYPSGKAVGYQKSICNEYKNVNNAFSLADYGIYSDHPSLTNTYFRMPNADVNTRAEFLAWIAQHPIQLVYELATPQTYQLTPQEVDTLVGQNNVWVNTGDVSVTYQASIKGYIDKVLAS